MASVIAGGLRLLLAALSFMGLCCFAQDRLKLEPFFAPLVAASGVMIALMLFGMAGALRWGWRLLVAGGIAAFAWRCAARRGRLDWLPAGLLAASAVYLMWHFHGAYFTGNDSLSHWAMAAKYLLRTDAFPDASTELIFFPSYPLGTASWIYFWCRMTAAGADVYLCVHYLLSVIGFLPLLALLRRRRAAGGLLAGAVLAFMLASSRQHYSLQVDALMSYMAVGATVIVCFYHDRPRTAMAAALPVAAALVFVKSSGIFFSLLIAALLYGTARGGDGRVARRALGMSLLVIALAFALWQGHVRLAYGRSAGGAHDVSLAYYQGVISEKTASLALSIARGMLRRLFGRGLRLLPVALFAADALLIRLTRADGRVWWPRFKRAALCALAVYLLWYGMIYLMYLFSMPVGTAASLASIDRYELTGVLYAIGTAAAFMLSLLCRADADAVRLGGRIGLNSILAVSAAAAFLALDVARDGAIAENLLARQAEKPYNYAYCLNILENCDVEEEKSYLVFADSQARLWSQAMYVTRYEFFSMDIKMLLGNVQREGYTPGAYAVVGNITRNGVDAEEAPDIGEAIARNIDDYDYLLVYDRDPVFEAALDEFLSGYEGNTQVLYGY